MSPFSPMRDPAPVRKYAASVWRAPNDPSVHAMVDIDYSHAAEFVTRYNARHDVKVTPTHLVARAMGLLLNKYPEGNATVTWRGFELRNSADVSIMIAIDAGNNLSNTKIEATNTLPLAEIERQLRKTTAEVRSGKDKFTEDVAKGLRGLPLWASRLLFRVVLFATHTLRLDMTFMDVPNDLWGGAAITSIGTFGYETAFSSLIPKSDCAMFVAVTAVREMPWVVDGKVVPRKVLRLCCTADHRIIDGALGGKYLAGLKDYVSNPESLLTSQEAADWAAEG